MLMICSFNCTSLSPDEAALGDNLCGSLPSLRCKRRWLASLSHWWELSICFQPNWNTEKLQLKLFALDIPLVFHSYTSSAVYTFNFPARNLSGNSPNLGVSILPSEPSPHGYGIRGFSTLHTVAEPLLSSHMKLVKNFTPWCVRLWLTETLPNICTLFVLIGWDWKSNPGHLCSSGVR